MRFKIASIIFLVIVFLSIVSAMSVLWYYDPLHVFHKQFDGQDLFARDMRYQSAGIINNYDFDSLILGTSMMENTSAKEASQVLGGHFFNLSIFGGDFYERSYVLKYALNKHDIKNVIYSLDSLGVIEGKKTDSAMYDFLYDNNPLNDFRIYSTDKYLRCLSIFSKDGECIGFPRNIDRPNSWSYRDEHKVRFGGLDNWFKAENNDQIKEAFKDIVTTYENIKNGKSVTDNNHNETLLKQKEYVNNTLLKYVKKHPDTVFYLFFPPYSRIEFATYAQYEKSDYHTYKYIMRYLVDETKKYPNMKIYAWGNNDFIDDIANYKDLRHYHESINSWMLTAMKNNEGLLTDENIEQYLRTFDEKNYHYDFSVVGERIKSYLENSNPAK